MHCRSIKGSFWRGEWPVGGHLRTEPGGYFAEQRGYCANPTKSQRLGDGSGGPCCVFWWKVCPKKGAKRVPERVERELKNRARAKHGKCGFDTVFIGFWPCRHSQKSHVLGLLWGSKVGCKHTSTRKQLRCRPLEALVNSWRVFWQPAFY